MRHLCQLLLLLLLTISTQFLADTPVTYIWNYADYVNLAKNPGWAWYKDIVRRAEDIIAKEPVAVTDKSTTLSGDKHNYESLSIYWWPDPKNPNGPYIARDGQKNPEYNKYDLQRLTTLRANLVVPAQAFFITRDDRYFDYFCRQIDVWFIDRDTRMTPNFEYSQFIPGRNNGHGNPQGMAEVNNFNNILESIRLVNSAKSIGRGRMKALQTWFSDFAHWMQYSDYGQQAQAFKNGQTLTFDVTLYNIFIFTGKKDGRQDIFDAFHEKRVMAQIKDDGSMPEALRRTKGFSYSVVNLERFVTFISLTKSDGNMLPKESLARIKQAFTFLRSFENNREAFPYSEIGNWDEQTKELEKQWQKFQTYLKD